tara:strand:- start:438 stop:971 length:534 start_codon:yes stop_codon:yes gene_type:complete
MRKIHIFLFLSIIISCTDSSINTDIEFCRCIFEPAISDWSIANEDKCNKDISSKMGVKDWKTINFSNNVDLSEKWDNMVNECVSIKLDIDSKQENKNEITFNEARIFIKERLNNIGQTYIDGKSVDYNSNLKLYYFLSESNQYRGYLCLSCISSDKLDLIGNTSCGSNEIITLFKSK